MKVLVLDAMGVIYSVGDDVKDLLCPFIAEKGGSQDTSMIGRLYHLANLGNISAFEFWRAVDVDPELEDEYLQKHKLTDGLIDFLKVINSRGYEVWCLSNDLSEWSRKLRVRFSLDKYICGFVVSGDIGARKPDQPIFQYLIDQLGGDPSCAIIVDDQLKNLDAASAFGLGTILFAPAGYDLTSERHQAVASFDDLLLFLSGR